MAKQVEFWFDIISPASYIAWTQIDALEEETGAVVVRKPFFLPGLFKAAGSASPITIPAKGRWLFQDLKRFAKRYNVPFRMNDSFPLNSLYIMRGLIAWQERPELKALTDGYFKAMWADNVNVNDPENAAAIVRAAGVNPQAWQAALEDPAIKQSVFDISEALAERGAFGAPTFFVQRNGREEMHWGQDRLDFVKEALSDVH